MEAGGDGRARLRSLKHIVVVMMENRSFDHMLGYLHQHDMPEVDGLTGNEFNLDRDGKAIGIHPFDADKSAVQRRGEALQKKLDPDHSPDGVQVQLGPGYGDEGTNGGFVKSFVESRKKEDEVGPDLWNVPMGYYTGKDVPVYDHLAREYCVCDRWFCSIPGDTWPNRLYAMAGRAGPSVIKSSGFLKGLTSLPLLKKLRGLPLFDVEAFTHQLERHQWRWYSHDPATLRAADEAYRDLGDLMRDNFAFFDRRKVGDLAELLEGPIVREASFLDDVASNDLPQVSWIDPNFYDLRVRETSSNDDHPPSDIRAGQAFVFDVYDALRRSEHWDDTLLVVTYDEHGGFFDHVMPPQLPNGDEAPHSTYGLRVPALIAGPRVRNQVLHEPDLVDDGREPCDQPQFDHTTLIKTILRAFAKNYDEAISNMPSRVQRAPDLSCVLLDKPRADIGDPADLRAGMEEWRQNARRMRSAQPASELDPAERGGGTRSVAPDGAGQPVVLTDFQEDWLKFAIAAREQGIDV